VVYKPTPNIPASVNNKTTDGSLRDQSKKFRRACEANNTVRSQSQNLQNLVNRARYEVSSISAFGVTMARFRHDTVERMYASFGKTKSDSKPWPFETPIPCNTSVHDVDVDFLGLKTIGYKSFYFMIASSTNHEQHAVAERSRTSL